MQLHDFRIHGNGFVQADLDDTTRVHLWHPSIPRQKVDTSIHNHTFSFTSEVKKGTLININLITTSPHSYNPSPNFRLYVANPRKDEDTKLVPFLIDGLPCDCVFYANSTSIFTPGKSYDMPSDVFHISVALGLTITVMKKVKEFGGRPLVACPIDQIPDNDFDRYGHQDFLDANPWIIEEMESVA